MRRANVAGGTGFVHMPSVTAHGVFFDRLITPRRALSPRALAVLLTALVAWNVLVGGFLFAVGAWPVPVFLGLDVAALGLAFGLSNRRARTGERITVSALAVTVERGSGAVVWTAPPAWTRVEAPPAGSRAPLRLCASGRSVVIGAALGAGERRRFAEALAFAVAAARRGR